MKLLTMALLTVLGGLPLAVQAGPPNTIPHQGRVSVNNSNYHGNAEFKFVLFQDDDTIHNNGGETALWANDDNTSVAFAEPASSVSLPVNRGLYSVNLGDVSLMTALPRSIAPAQEKRLFLRVWFDGGSGTFQAFNPAMEISPVAMALTVPGNAMGRNTLALGKNAAAFGVNTVASGDYSTTFGNFTFAPSALEVAMGRFNTQYVPASTSSWNTADRLLVIGNGTSIITPADILTIRKDGSMDYNGTMTVDGTLVVDGALVVTGNTEVTGNYTYASPEEYKLQLPAAAFSLNPAGAMGGTETQEGYLDFNSHSTAIQMYAPVDLPLGATITSVVVGYYDNDNSAGFGTLSPPTPGFYRKAFTSTASPQLVCDLSFTSTDISAQASMRYLTKSGGDILFPTVNEYQYWIVLSPFSVSGGGGTFSANLRVYGVQITYTLDKVSQ